MQGERGKWPEAKLNLLFQEEKQVDGLGEVNLINKTRFIALKPSTVYTRHITAGFTKLSYLE